MTNKPDRKICPVETPTVQNSTVTVKRSEIQNLNEEIGKIYETINHAKKKIYEDSVARQNTIMSLLEYSDYDIPGDTVPWTSYVKNWLKIDSKGREKQLELLDMIYEEASRIGENYLKTYYDQKTIDEQYQHSVSNV